MSEGQCPACRAAKAEIHRSPAGYGTPLLIATALLLVLLIVLAARGGVF